MGRCRYLANAVAFVGAVLISSGLTGFASTDAAAMNAADAVAAIQNVAPEAVSDVAAVTSDPDTAVKAKIGHETTVSVPVDAVEGIRVDAPGAPADMTIGLPFADQAARAAASPAVGVVAYDNFNGSSTVPVTHRDGTIQITTVIENENSPTRYDYIIGFRGGQGLTLKDNGAVSVSSSDGSYRAEVATPWAKDANGHTVPTHYEVHGSTLTQIVEFDAETAFPVVADPSVITTTYTYSRADVERMWNTYQFYGTICNVIPGLNYMVSLLCPGGARLQDAVNSAHYQAKRVRASFYNCGFTYCNYYEYKVVS